MCILSYFMLFFKCLILYVFVGYKIDDSSILFNNFLFSSSFYAYSIKISDDSTKRSFCSFSYNPFGNHHDSIVRDNTIRFLSNDPLRVESFNFYRNLYSFVPYNIFNSSKNGKYKLINKIGVTHSILDENLDQLPLNYRNLSHLNLFGKIKNWFCDEFIGWYVPPMPTGERKSYQLRNMGPIQTDEETKEFFSLIGATLEDSLFEVLQKYRYVMSQTPKYAQGPLKHFCKEYLRRYFVENFEYMESVAAKGSRAWAELWRPQEDDYKNDYDVLTKEDQQFISIWPNRDKMEKMLISLKKKRRSMRTIEIKRLRGIVRFSKDFKGRFSKCLKTMFPLMAVGLIPQLGPLSIGISSMLASKIIYKGDKEDTKHEIIDHSRFNPHTDYDRSETGKSIATLAVVGAHSMIGYIISSLVKAYTKLGSMFPSETINSFFINMQLTLSAILYDTSEMSYEEKVQLSKKKKRK